MGEHLDVSFASDIVSVDSFRFLFDPMTSLNRKSFSSLYRSSKFSSETFDLSATCACLEEATKIESSLSGESTFLKKLNILLFGFVPIFDAGIFFVLDFGAGALVLEFGRGVRGFVEDIVDIVGCGRGRSPFGGVGARPVEGLVGASVVGLNASRGLRNILPWECDDCVMMLHWLQNAHGSAQLLRQNLISV